MIDNHEALVSRDQVVAPLSGSVHVALKEYARPTYATWVGCVERIDGSPPKVPEIEAGRMMAFGEPNMVTRGTVRAETSAMAMIARLTGFKNRPPQVFLHSIGAG